LVEFSFHMFFQQDFAIGQNLLNVRPELARFRIDDLKLLFDSEGVDMIFRSRLLRN